MTVEDMLNDFDFTITKFAYYKETVYNNKDEDIYLSDLVKKEMKKQFNDRLHLSLEYVQKAVETLDSLWTPRLILRMSDFP